MCLCGSTRFLEAFDAASLRETLAGNVVLSVGSHRTPDAKALTQFSELQRAEIFVQLAELHRHKIKLADEILVINFGGYIGETTRSEIEFAHSLGKVVRYLEAPALPTSH